MNRVALYDEYRLIERSETEINGAWKGAHLLLFFMAFVFGSFCTFCFHMLMYLFDEKCVLFPKLLSLTSLRHNVIYEFIPSNKELADMPVDFLSTQWVEKSTCSLPTYVPLVSGIFGLVWITMFLMCSTGSRTLTGLQRPWRVVPPVFVFSLAMSCLCIYSSAVTHYGLQELCIKLGEITGSSTCTYTVNVATLAYERRIRGVYQATRLTILTAWLHTACWLLSALLALVRVLMAVDFQLVRVNVELIGDIDKILEKHEVQIRTVSPEFWINDDYTSDSDTRLRTKDRENKTNTEEDDQLTELYDINSKDIIPYLNPDSQSSELSLIPEERNRIARHTAYKTVSKDKIFIVKWLYDLVDTMHIPEVPEEEIKSLSSDTSSSSQDLDHNDAPFVIRQYGQEKFISKGQRENEGDVSKTSVNVGTKEPEANAETVSLKEALAVDDDYKFVLNRTAKKIIKTIKDLSTKTDEEPSTSRTPVVKLYVESSTTTDEDLIGTDDKDDKAKDKIGKKSNLKTIGVQTEKGKKGKQEMHVQISGKNIPKHESDTDEESEKKDDVDKETQTRPKEKQD